MYILSYIYIYIHTYWVYMYIYRMCRLSKDLMAQVVRLERLAVGQLSLKDCGLDAPLGFFGKTHRKTIGKP